MMMKSLFIAAYAILIEAEHYEVLVQQDANQCYFNKLTITDNNGNQGTPTDPCYSNIGTVEAIQDDYKDDNGAFHFRLTYYKDNVPTVLVWSQESWITESTLVGADLSQIPTQTYSPSEGQYFHGLGINSAYPDYSFLDGSPGANTAWWCAVVAYQAYAGGIPGFNRNVADGNKLEILVPERDCLMNTNEICSEIELNTDSINSVSGRVDSVNDDLNIRIDSVDSALNARIDTVDGDLNNRIDSANARIDTLVGHLQDTAAAHAFNGDVISDSKHVFGDSFQFSQTELLLLAINMVTIVFGLFICWKGGLFSKNKKRGYAKVNQYYESDAVEKPINA